MNTGNTNYNYDMIEVSISDMVLSIFRKWPIIIAVALISGVLLGGLRGLRSMTSAGTKEQQVQLEAIEEYEQALSLYNFNLEAKEGILKTYTDSRELLLRELESLKSIPDDDEVGRTASLIKINHLKSVMDNANNALKNYANGTLVKPEEPADIKTSGASGGFSFSKRYAMVGAVLGAFLICMVFALMYIFDGTVKSPHILERTLGVALLGDSEKTAFVAANVRNMIPGDVKSILITSGLKGQDLSEVAKSIEALNGGIYKVNVAEEINKKAESAALIYESDAIVLVETLRKSKLVDIADEISMIKNSGKKLIGIAI